MAIKSHLLYHRHFRILSVPGPKRPLVFVFIMQYDYTLWPIIEGIGLFGKRKRIFFYLFKMFSSANRLYL